MVEGASPSLIMPVASSPLTMAVAAMSKGLRKATHDKLHEQAQKVSLKADSLLYCGMVTGAKVMHTKEHDNIPFLPHESFILAPKEEVFIELLKDYSSIVFEAKYRRIY